MGASSIEGLRVRGAGQDKLMSRKEGVGDTQYSRTSSSTLAVVTGTTFSIGGLGVGGLRVGGVTGQNRSMSQKENVHKSQYSQIR
jgi:hypothetical protein